jgi:predicted DNA-binding mobile mystery protein A
MWLRANSLIQNQLEHQSRPYKEILRANAALQVGWIRMTRKALGMSLRQLGERMGGIAPSSVQKIETNEIEGKIKLETLRQAARALGMELVIGFAPIEDSVKLTVQKQALKIATSLMTKVNNNMELEAQALDSEQLNEAIKEEVAELLRTMPNHLWNT